MIATREKVKYTKKQGKALNLLMDSTTKYILYGGAAGGGKTFLSIAWLVGLAQNYPDTRFFVGRDELKRLRDSWLVTFYKFMTMVGCPSYEYSYNGSDHYFLFKNGSRIDLLDLKYLPSDMFYERYGSVEYTSGVMEEGGETNFGAFDVLKTRIGRYNNDKYGLLGKILITANPKKNWLYKIFYLPNKAGNLHPEYAFVPALASDNHFLDSGYISNLESITDKVTKERLKYGNWEYDDSENSLIPYDNILNLFTNQFVPGGSKYITADIARFGKDKTTIGLWNGYRLERIVVLIKNSITETAREIRALASANQIPMSCVIVDEDGVGGGVKDILNCRGFVNNSSPISLKGANYNNLKSQCSFMMADEINANKVYIKPTGEKEQKEIVEELEQLKDNSVDTDGKKAIVPKDKVKDIIGRSPDYSDMMIMRKYFDLPHVSKITGWR